MLENIILIYCSSSCYLTVHSRNINKNTSENWSSNLFNEVATRNSTLLSTPPLMAVFFSGLLELTFKPWQEASRKSEDPTLWKSRRVRLYVHKSKSKRQGEPSGVDLRAFTDCVKYSALLRFSSFPDFGMLTNL